MREHLAHAQNGSCWWNGSGTDSQADAGGPSACWETPASQLIEQLIGSESTQHDDVLYKLFIDFESEGF